MHERRILHRDIKPENIVLIMVTNKNKCRAMLRFVILDGQRIKCIKQN